MRRFGVLLALALILTMTSASTPVATCQSQAKARKSSQGDLEDYYKKWLKEDVVYIITDEERKVFRSLTTPEEKDAFIEQFWKRRERDPRTAANEFREEHYRRIAYANEHFASGVDGWATDRGRIYIKFGPPTNIESNPGGPYQRRYEEGGGWTSTYAFQRWYYNSIPGVGTGIEIEFVDASKTGEYRIALRPSEKDALWQAGTGLTREELAANPDDPNRVTRAGVMLSDFAMRNIGMPGEPSYMSGAQSFDRVRQYFSISKPPQIRFDDLRGVVEARITYNLIPLKTASGAFRVAADAYLVPFTIQIPAEELTFKTNMPEVKQSRIKVYGRVENLTGQVVYEFEDEVLGYGRDGAGFKPGTNFLYQKQIPLRAGRYKLTAVVSEEASKRTTTAVSSIQLPGAQLGSLTTSTLVLADGITSSLATEAPSDPFITPSGLKIHPNVADEFRPGSRLSFYIEAYEVAVDQSDNRARLYASLILSREREVVKKIEPKMVLLGDRVAVLDTINLAGLPPGPYNLLLELNDRISGQSVVRRGSFKITE